jgi:asparagine synthetase B (glutamine-hydrolysing)
VRRVKNLHTADCLRANKSTMAWGLEARVPFLDTAFLSAALALDPAAKMFSKGSAQEVDEDGCPRMEKYVIRKAFDCAPDGKPYLPRSILWRQKEQFSDGVGYSWIDGMKAHAAAAVSDEQFAARAERFPQDTPDTKEAYLIRDLFHGLFPSDAAASTAVRCALRPPLTLLTLTSSMQMDPTRRLGLRRRPERARREHPHRRVWRRRVTTSEKASTINQFFSGYASGHEWNESRLYGTVL